MPSQVPATAEKVNSRESHKLPRRPHFRKPGHRFGKPNSWKRQSEFPKISKDVQICPRVGPPKFTKSILENYVLPCSMTYCRYCGLNPRQSHVKSWLPVGSRHSLWIPTDVLFQDANTWQSHNSKTKHMASYVHLDSVSMYVYIYIYTHIIIYYYILLYILLYIYYYILLLYILLYI